MDSKMIISGTNNVPFIPSSSPPPIENVEHDIPDDFSEFAFSSDEQFDITGLSQKLDKCMQNSLNEHSSLTGSTFCDSNFAIENSVNHDPTTSSLKSFHNHRVLNKHCFNDSEAHSTVTPPPLTQVGQNSDSLYIIASQDGCDHSSIVERFDFNADLKISNKDQDTVKDISFSQLVDERICEFQSEDLNLSQDTYSHVDQVDDFGEFVSSIDDEKFDNNLPISGIVLPEGNNSEEEMNCEINEGVDNHVGNVIDNLSNEPDDIIAQNINSLPNDGYEKPNLIQHNHQLTSCEREFDGTPESLPLEPKSNVDNYTPSRPIEDLGRLSSSDDDFGDFASNVCNAQLSSVISDDSNQLKPTSSDFISNETEDEFGDFNCADEFELEFSDDEETEIIDNFSKDKLSSSNKASNEPNSMFGKFKTLVSRWLKYTIQDLSEDYEIGVNIARLDDLAARDSYIWSLLQDVESSSSLKISWSNTDTNKHFLSSLDVDARNIFYSNKWNSSIPLFAQTLSFSPLTPAKTTSVNTTDVKNISSVEVLNPSRSEEENSLTKVVLPQKEITDKHREVIPPAQFDWSSSGLTNPLDDPELEREILDDVISPTPASKPSPILEKILKEKTTGPSITTDLSTLPSEVEAAVKRLPDLSFMRSKVLMFPILDDSLQ